MSNWEELSQQGERRPGGVNEKASEVIAKAREKEDPDKVPYHPGLEKVEVKNGKLDLQAFSERERKARPEVIDGNSILNSSPEARSFAMGAEEEARSKEDSPENQKVPERSATDQFSDSRDFGAMSYTKKLEYFKIEEGKAREILDSLFSEDGFYEEKYQVGKMKFAIRTARGEPLNYIFSKLAGWNKMSPDGQSITDEYMHHKNMYLIATMLVSCNGQVFLDSNGQKTPDMIEKTKDYVMGLPDVVGRMLVEKMIDFEAVIKIVTGEGCENFF